MTSERNSPGNGQESSGTANELQIDHGVSRRVFLGAAAAFSTLSAVCGKAAAGTGNEEEYTSTKGSDTDYGFNNIVDTSGGLDLHVEMDRDYGTSVTVSSHPEGIALRLSNKIGSMDVLLLPEDIDPLCQKLLDAKAKTRPEAVEESRERITENYRTGNGEGK